MSTLFFSYSHRDEELRNELETHLEMLKRQGQITTWHDRKLNAGDVIDTGISLYIEQASIILLLISPDFLASSYCYDVEMTCALQRQRDGLARVIPIILRPCDWHRGPFGNLLAAPTDGKPITTWNNKDEAFLSVVQAIRVALPTSASSSVILTQSVPTNQEMVFGDVPRSSNLRVKKTFTEKDQDDFLHNTFEYISRFFENSLQELEGRNQGIESRFRSLDANRFTAAVYQGGTAQARCSIFIGGFASRNNSIGYNNDDSGTTNSFNERLSIEVGEQSLSLKSWGMGTFSGQQSEHLTENGAAELLWSMFIGRLR